MVSKLIDNYLAFLRKNINYSLSGFKEGIFRRDGKGYQNISNLNKSHFYEIHEHFKRFNFEEGIKLIFKYRMADCWHQALILDR